MVPIDGESQEKLCTVLTSVTSKARTVICEQAPKPAVKARLTGFFNAVTKVQRDIGGDMPMKPKVVAHELNMLCGQCTGPLSRFRARITEAKLILEGAS